MIDGWIARKIGLKAGEGLTREALGRWQLERLRETVLCAKNESLHYAGSFVHLDPEKDLQSLCDIEKLPFTDESALKSSGSSMLCVPASRVSRIVTLDTSGTTGSPKRVCFTEADQELMADYIHNGL